MFDEYKEYTKQRKLKKKASNTVQEKKVENQMRLELREKLQKYLLNNDIVQIEIDKKYISMFLAIVEDEFATDYDFEQVTETLYNFKAKEIEWVS